MLLPFRTGVFGDGQNLQPIILKYPFKKFNPAFTGLHEKNGQIVKTNIYFYLWRFFSQFSHNLEVTYLPFRKANSEEKQFPRVYAKNVQNEMSAALKIPVSIPKRLYF
ncbi:hypothetical protein MHBO_003103 [Bonamia ostreae]|uniref:LAGLIDADG homing endonuclease n=1 Tax=Bonamia ostreae TaxID=126728 RepID=A0ABV2APH3_9EUKA